MFWNLFRGKKTQKDDNLSTPTNHSSFKNENIISRNEIFLLHYLRNRKIEWKIDEPVKKLFFDYYSTLSSLKERGYLTDDNHSYFLQVMNIYQLKEILRSLSLPLTGKKSELIQRILANTSESDRMEICQDLYYVLTEKAILLDEEYKREQKQLNSSLKATMQYNISVDNFEQAALERASNFSERIIPPGIGIDWSDTESILKANTRELEELQKYDFSDLKNSSIYKKALIQALYYDNQIEHNLYQSIKTFVIPTGEKILCNDLDIFFQNKGFTPEEIQKVFVYLDTKRYNHFQIHMRTFQKNGKYKPLPSGNFKLADETLDFWKEYDEYKNLSERNIDGFPKTFQTFQKHKKNNSEKYKIWLSKK